MAQFAGDNVGTENHPQSAERQRLRVLLGRAHGEVSGVHAQNIFNGDAVAGLFEGFPQRGFVSLFTGFHTATGQGPEGAERAVFGHPTSHKQLALLNNDCVGCGSGFHC